MTDLNFLCKNELVIQSINACESALCSPTDQHSKYPAVLFRFVHDAMADLGKLLLPSPTSFVSV